MAGSVDWTRAVSSTYLKKPFVYSQVSPVQGWQHPWILAVKAGDLTPLSEHNDWQEGNGYCFKNGRCSLEFKTV